MEIKREDRPGRQGKRRKFTDEFKAGATRLVLDENKTIAQVARDLDVTASVLRTWVILARANRDGGKTGLMTDERAELAALRKELRVVKMERDILGNDRAQARSLLARNSRASSVGVRRGAAVSFMVPRAR
jgi:transposase